jgi:hypothetical protein
VNDQRRSVNFLKRSRGSKRCQEGGWMRSGWGWRGVGVGTSHRGFCPGVHDFEEALKAEPLHTHAKQKHHQEANQSINQSINQSKGNTRCTVRRKGGLVTAPMEGTFPPYHTQETMARTCWGTWRTERQ